jgi:hypothetical protein
MDGGNSAADQTLQVGMAPERSNPDAPRAVSNRADQRPDGRPRSETVAIRREDNGLIGT